MRESSVAVRPHKLTADASEFARVFGVDFHSVLTRGSQFKVESVMFKISKPENFMLPSPSREDVRFTSPYVGAAAYVLARTGWQAKRCGVYAADPRA